jgi:hypothetical protein
MEDGQWAGENILLPVVLLTRGRSGRDASTSGRQIRQDGLYWIYNNLASWALALIPNSNVPPMSSSWVMEKLFTGWRPSFHGLHVDILRDFR